MAKKENVASEKLNYLRSDLATIRFASRGHLGEASDAIEPVLQAFESLDKNLLPKRMSKTFREQTECEIEQLKKAGLKRVVRITDPELCSSQSNGNLGFARWIDASREWRECELYAAVLEQYIDLETGECVIENYDSCALLTVRQSRHIRASDQKKNKNKKTDIYVREHYNCPSCGAELEHIADETNCPYCGAVITFNFFDWQLDGFYLDMSEATLVDEVKTVAGKTAFYGAIAAIKVVGILADKWDREAEKTDTNGNFDNYLGALLTVILVIGFTVLVAFFALPFYARIAIGVAIAAFIIWQIFKYLRATEQKRKKKKIVRYSDGYLRSCVYNEVWKDVEMDHLIDFSIDDIILKSVKNTEQSTTIDVVATVIKKYMEENRKIRVFSEKAEMQLSRARYPEKKRRNKGKMMVEKECPSCGANFEPDEHHCCSYCGYGLKMENFVWRRYDPKALSEEMM